MTTVSIRTQPPAPFPTELPADFLAYQAQFKETFFSIVTPLNITIVVLLATLLYFRFRATDAVSLPAQTPITFRTFTPRTLLPYNGKPSKPHNPDGLVYLAVKGKVYDVTSGRNFYGPGGPYENFAGRDATRGLACQSFDEEMLTKDLDGPLDDLRGLGKDEMENLKGWEERFDEKYLIVGKLTAFGRLKQSSQL